MGCQPERRLSVTLCATVVDFGAAFTRVLWKFVRFSLALDSVATQLDASEIVKDVNGCKTG